MTAIIINFKRSTPVHSCYLENTNITCYEVHSCLYYDEDPEFQNYNIYEFTNNKRGYIERYLEKHNINDILGESPFTENRFVEIRCSKEEIDLVINSMSKDEEVNKEVNDKIKNKPKDVLSNKVYIIIIISLITLGILLFLWWIHNKKRDKGKKIEHNGRQLNKLPTVETPENNNIYINYMNTHDAYLNPEKQMNNTNLPECMDSYNHKNIHFNFDTIQYDDKNSNEHIVDAELISNIPSNYEGIIRRLNTNIDNNMSRQSLRQSLPPYAEIDNYINPDFSNNNNNTNANTNANTNNNTNNEYDYGNNDYGDDIKLINELKNGELK